MAVCSRALGRGSRLLEGESESPFSPCMVRIRGWESAGCFLVLLWSVRSWPQPAAPSRGNAGLSGGEILGESGDRCAMWRGCRCCFSGGGKLLGWFAPGSSQPAAGEAEMSRDLSPVIGGSPAACESVAGRDAGGEALPVLFVQGMFRIPNSSQRHL